MGKYSHKFLSRNISYLQTNINFPTKLFGFFPVHKILVAVYYEVIFYCFVLIGLIRLLTVCVVPPDILDYPTSTDIIVDEGSDVSLRCVASGSPEPNISWKREDGEFISLDGESGC